MELEEETVREIDFISFLVCSTDGCGFVLLNMHLGGLYSDADGRKSRS